MTLTDIDLGSPFQHGAWVHHIPNQEHEKTMKMPQQQRKATVNNKEIKNIFRKSL